MNRRMVLETAVLAGATVLAQTPPGQAATTLPRSPYVAAKDGTKLFVQDWGTGRPVVWLAAWTFNSNVWGSHIAAFAANGFRCIAPDRRGHGRSDVPPAGYDLDTLTDDLASVIAERDLHDVTLVAHSMGGIEAVNYLARYGSSRVSRLVLAAPTTPYIVKTEDNPEGVPPAMIEAQYEAIARDYPQWLAANEAPFFTPDTPAITRDWIKAMMLSVPLPVALACRATISAADLRSALARIDCPTLIVHGDKDASAPLPLTGARTAKLIPGSRLKVYGGAPHALVLTHREQFLADLLAFIG
jgi:pimeloyl-ACP methyl ester carboxylesterase